MVKSHFYMNNGAASAVAYIFLHQMDDSIGDVREMIKKFCEYQKRRASIHRLQLPGHLPHPGLGAYALVYGMGVSIIL